MCDTENIGAAATWSKDILRIAPRRYLGKLNRFVLTSKKACYSSSSSSGDVIYLIVVLKGSITADHNISHPAAISTVRSKVFDALTTIIMVSIFSRVWINRV